jgi:protoheme ferro-lyase
MAGGRSRLRTLRRIALIGVEAGRPTRLRYQILSAPVEESRMLIGWVSDEQHVAIEFNGPVLRFAKTDPAAKHKGAIWCVCASLAQLLPVIPINKELTAFFDDPGFIAAWEAVGRPVLESAKPDHVLFSFHGLPERQIRKADDSGSHCLTHAACCDTIQLVNRNCYRAQCFATARHIATALRLPADRYTVSFQSRLGRDPWIKPYTDHLLRDFPEKGVKRLVVFCPAFVADCLETLEEIELRGRDAFLAAGGDAFAMVPSLNTHPRWVETVVELIRKALG